MSLLNEFIDYLKHEVEVHSIYVIGAQGQRGKEVTEEWIRYRERENQRNADRAVRFWKKQVAAGYGDVLGAFDCSGLGMYWLQNVKGIYPSDLNANGMYSKCSTKLTKDQLKKGDWVFVDTNGRKTHIGYIVDDNLTVIESRGRDYGVVSGKLDSRWTHFGRPDCFKDEIEGGTSSMSINIVATQSYSSLLNSIKNEAATKVIIQNLINKLWFRNDDLFTIETAQKQIGKEDKTRISKSFSENAQKTFYNYFTNSLNSKDSSISESISSFVNSDFVYDYNFFTRSLETFSCLSFLSNGDKIISPDKLKLFPYFQSKK